MSEQLKRFCFLGILFVSLVQQSASADVMSQLPKGMTQLSTVEGITEYRLENGLTVLLMPDAAKPTVTVNVTYLVGSRQENYGETGMAHLLEHMLFKGTPLIPQIDVDFNKRGMNSNASTSLDRTNFFEQFQASDDNLQWAITMEADRMVHSNIAKKDLDSEMTVVRNEFEQGENSPINVLLKRLQSVAYDWHNYGNSTIGNRSDIENVKIENLRAFYHQYYQPDNAVLVVAGKFDVRKTLGWIASEFGSIPKPKRSLPPIWTVEPTQDGEKQVVVRRKGDTEIVMVAYKIPAELHPDYLAVSFAADILVDNPTGRLYKSLVDSGKAVEVFNTVVGNYEPSLVVIGAVVKNGDPIEPVKDALVAGIEHFAGTPPTTEELDRVKRDNLNQIEKTLADPEAIGLEISDVLALGDWRYYFQRRDDIEKVTSKQVASSAARYFTRDNRTVGLFLPEDESQRVNIPAAPAMVDVMQGFTPKLDVQTAEAFDPSPENIDKRTVHTKIGGLNVAMLSKKNRGNTVSVTLSLHWGDEKSLFGKKATALLTKSMLMRGNSKYSGEQLDDEMAKLKIIGDTDHFSTTRENLPAALELIGQILKEPSFPKNEFEQLKKQTLSKLESTLSDPQELARQAIGLHFNHYPKGDWRDVDSIAESMADTGAVTLDDLKAHHKNFYGASHGELSIVGDFDVDVMTGVIQRTFGNWVSQAPYAHIADKYVDVLPRQINVNTPDKENGFYLAKMNVNLFDEDPQYPALVVANYILGGGAELNSRIMERIRTKDGLSYGGRSILTVHSLDNAANFQIAAIAAPQNLMRVKLAVNEEINRVLKEGFSAEEVASAKSGLKQQAVQSRSQDSKVADGWNKYVFKGRTFAWDRVFENKVDALTVDEVNSAFRKWIDPTKLTIVIAGDDAKKGLVAPTIKLVP